MLAFEIEALVYFLLQKSAIFEISAHMIKSIALLKHALVDLKLDTSVSPVSLLDEMGVKLNGSQRID